MRKPWIREICEARVYPEIHNSSKTQICCPSVKMFYESMLQRILMGSAYEIIGDYVPNVQLRFLHNHRVIQFVEFLRRYMNMKTKIHGFLGVCEYVRWRVYIVYSSRTRVGRDPSGISWTGEFQLLAGRTGHHPLPTPTHF